MRTPDHQLAADQHLDADAPHPPADRREYRCRCRHSLDAHRRPTIADLNAPGLPAPTPCGRCSCGRYASRPAVWSVRRHEQFVDLWIVRSPRGTRVHSSHDRAAAIAIARQFAGVDALFARIAAIERRLSPIDGQVSAEQAAAMDRHPSGSVMLDAIAAVETARSAVADMRRHLVLVDGEAAPDVAAGYSAAGHRPVPDTGNNGGGSTDADPPPTVKLGLPVRLPGEPPSEWLAEPEPTRE